MKFVRYGNMNVSVIAAGTMRIAGFNEDELSWPPCIRDLPWISMESQ